MLRELNIENVAVIEKAQVQFGRGLNILTGETGAGKSILIDSINAILGNRTSREIVRTGTDRSVIWAVFTDISPAISCDLRQRGYEWDDELIIQREIGADGRSNCRICGKPATAAVIRDICSGLINIHGQHDNQDLLNADRHIVIIDNFAESTPLLEEYARLYSELGKLQRTMDQLSVNDALKERRLDLLRYQIEEIEKAQLTPGEEETLTERRDLIRNSEKILLALRGAYEALSGGQGDGAQGLLFTASSQMEQISQISESLTAVAGRLTDSYYAVSDLSTELRELLDSFDFKADDAELIEERIDLLYRLKRKYGQNIDEILRFLDDSRQELSDMEGSDERLEQLRVQHAQVLAAAREKAGQLSDKRRASFSLFENRIKEELSFLNMPNVIFSVNCNTVELCPQGCDQIEFFISTNVGEPPKPMARIASGGELSRIMLAIKNALADKDHIDTLIFDEIDTGVSGSSAGKIGQKLKQSALGRQTICVTHTAQIAAYADSHLLIQKNVRDQRTYTEIVNLDRDARIQELARIISGDRVTETSLTNAAEMLALSGGA